MSEAASVKKRALNSPAFVTFWQVVYKAARRPTRLDSFRSCCALLLLSALSPDTAPGCTENGALHYLNGKIMLQIPPLWS